MNRGKQVHFLLAPGPGGQAEQPLILRRPEIIHGLRNLIQNAVDFARAEVWVQAEWNDQRLQVHIRDDGPGFPPQILGYIGEPFVRRRREAERQRDRPGYEGMGLGLFIAKTLLERSGAQVKFANHDGRAPDLPGSPKLHGALITLDWPLARILADKDAPLGRNEPLSV